MSINKVILVGNVGKDPEVKIFDNGNKVANFTIATSENYKNKDGEKVTKTEWHNVVVYRKLADIVESYVKKGNQLYVEGKIKTRSWEKDGEKRYTTEIICDSIKMLGGKPQSDSAQAPQSSGNAPQFEDEEDLPF